MKIKTEIEYEVTVRAVKRGKDLKLGLSVAAPYGDGRSATWTVEEFSKDVQKQVNEALQAALDEQLDEAVKRANIAAAEASVFAARKGEI